MSASVGRGFVLAVKSVESGFVGGELGRGRREVRVSQV